MKTVTIVGNWKMNTTPETAVSLASGIRGRLEGRKTSQARTILCPPFVSLEGVASALRGSEVSVGAQNVHSETSGAFTGEISAEMLRGLAEFVIVGHSERRTLFGESDDMIAAKVEVTQSVGLKPILCVGETFQQRRSGKARDTVERQTAQGLSRVSDLSQTMIAYEPVWAIGTGEAATPEVAQDMMASIRACLRSHFDAQADSVPLLYGGSVNAVNVREFVTQPDIDGALVGGASLSVDSFTQIVLSSAS